MSHIVWPVKYCIKAGTNLLSLTFKLLLGIKYLSDCKNNIAVQSKSGDIVLHCCIMIYDSWVTRVKFLQEIFPEKAKLESHWLNQNNKSSIFYMQSKIIFWKWLPKPLVGLWDSISQVCLCSVKIVPPVTPTFGGKKHWLLDIENHIDFCSVGFLKEKSKLKKVI